MNADKRVFIYVRVKAYVYKYFVRNYSVKNSSIKGAIRLESKDEAYTFIENHLRKPSQQYEKRYQDRNLTHRTHMLAIQIREYDFAVNGCCLTLTDETKLQYLLETRIHKLMIIWVGIHYMFEDKLKYLCEQWLLNNGMDETDWDVSSMVRMCNRAGISALKKEMKGFITQKMDELFTRTITNKKYFRTTKIDKNQDE